MSKLITPFGKASFPYLHEKNTRWSDDEQDHKFECGVILAAEAAETFQKKLKKLAKEGFDQELASAKTPKDKRKLREATKHMPWKPERDEDDELTGNIIFTAKGKSQPLVVDPAGEPMSPKVGSGSEVRLSVTPRFWAVADKVGLSLQLNAVQVAELVEWGAYSAPKTAEEAGFDAVGEGFASTDEDEEEEDTGDDWDDVEPDGEEVEDGSDF